MTGLPITESHYEALNRADPQIQHLVSSGSSLHRLREFVDQYSGPAIEVQAIYPVLNSIKAQFNDLKQRYELTRPEKTVFLASPQDAQTFETLFDFLWFATKNLYFKARYRCLTLLVDVDPFKFYLCANIEVAIAAMRLSVLCSIEPPLENATEDETLVELLDNMEVHTIIPPSGSLSTHVSDYAVFMEGKCNDQKDPHPQYTIEDFTICPTHTSISEIQRGMQTLPRDQWPQLVHKCRKLATRTCENSAEAQLLIGYDILVSISYDQLFYNVNERTPASSKSTRYAHILDANLIQEYPDLSKYAISVLTRVSGYRITEFSRIDDRLRDGELLVSAIQNRNAPLILAILEFYKRSSELSYMDNDPKILTTMGNFMVLEHLEKLSRDHTDLNVQIALLRVLVYSMKVDVCYDFALNGDFVEVIQSFFAMLKHQLELNSSRWLDFQIQKGLLSVIILLLEKDSSGVLAIANDSLSLPVLASTLSSCGDVGPLTIKCLVLFLNADLLCYSILENYKLWDTMIGGVRDPYALVQLYACLISSEHGLKLVEKHDLRTRLLESAIKYNFEPNFFSQKYYSSLTDAIVSDATTLAAFAQRVPYFLTTVLEYLNNHKDESCFDFEHRFWGGHSKTANLVFHTVHLLSSTAHRDAIRDQLQSNTGLPILLRILAHQHLPFAFPNSIRSHSRFSLLINELMLADTAQNLMGFLISGLVNLLQGDIKCPGIQRQAQIYLACVVNLNFRKSEDLTKKLIKWITLDPNFSKLAILLPHAMYENADQKFDLLSGADRAIAECYWYRLDSHRGHTSEMVMKQLLNDLSDCQYFEKKRTGRLVQHTGMALDAYRRCLLQFVDDLFQYRMVPEGFDPAIFATAVNDCFAKMDLSSTRGRYILAQLNPAYYITASSVDGLKDILFVNKGLEAIIDLYAKVHKPLRISEDDSPQQLVLLNAYYKSDYTQRCKEVIQEALSEFGTRCSMTQRLVDYCAEAGYNPMQAWSHMIKRVIEYHIPIRSELMYCFHCDEQDMSAFLPLRNYILENLQAFFKDQDIDGYRYGSKILAMTLNILEVYEPIMADLIPSLIGHNTVPELALVAGCYTLDEAKLNVPEFSDIDIVLPNVIDQDPIKVMCSAQIILSSGVEVPGSALPMVLESLLRCEIPGVLGVILELATRCVIGNSDLTPPPSTIEQVYQHCLRVFESGTYEKESILSLSHLQEFVIACCEADKAILEATMAGLVYQQAGKSPKPLSELQVELTKLSKRSPSALESSLVKHFLVLNNQVLVPRRLVCEAHQLPRVHGEISELSSASKQLIDQLIEQIIERLPLVIDRMQHLNSSRQASNTIYLHQAVENAYRTELTDKQRQVDSDYHKSWEELRKEVFRVRAYSDVLSHLTYFYGAGTIYLSKHDKIDTLLRSVLETAGHIAFLTEKQIGLSWITQVKNISEFVLRTINCGYQTSDLIFESIIRVLDSGSLYACLGFLRVCIFHRYDSSVMNSLIKSRLMDKINDVVTKGGCDPKLETCLRKGHSFFYNGLGVVWTEEMERFSSFKGKKSEVESEVKYDSQGGENEEDNREDEDENDYRQGSEESTTLPHSSSQDPPGSSGSNSSSESSSAILYRSEEIEDDYEGSSEREFSYTETDAVRVSSLFDVGDYVEYAKTYPRLSSGWRINPPIISADQGTTLEHSYEYRRPPDSEPLFFSSDNVLNFLCFRGLNLMPIHLPGDREYTPKSSPFYHYGGAVIDNQTQLIWAIPMFAGSDWGPVHVARRIMRPWMHGSVSPIDWTVVPRLELHEPAQTSVAATKEAPKPDIADDTPASVVAYELAIENGRHLLENPDELSQWGLSAEYLDTVPQEFRLDALIPYLTLNCGQEMTCSDIQATFNDDLAYDIAMTGNQDSVTKLSVSAQFSKDDDPTTQLNSARYSEKPVHPSITEHLLLDFGVFRPGSSESEPEIPCFSGNAALENKLLLLFRDLLITRSPLIKSKNVEPFINWLQKSESGNLAVGPLIDCLCSPIVLTQATVGLGQLLNTFKESVEKCLVEELELSTIKKLFSIYWSSFITPYKLRTLRQIILKMIERGFVKKATLQQIICEELTNKLKDCNDAICRGEVSDLTSLEDLLTALTRHPLLEIAGTTGIIQQAFEMSKNVSNVIKTRDITATMRLLRCYLLLVTLTPDARSAFIAFVEDNKRLVNKMILQDQTMLKSCCVNMKGKYHLLDFKVRAGMIRGRFPQSPENPLRLTIGRDRIFHESYTAIKAVPIEDFISSTFRLVFKAEMGFDGGGLTKEWLTVLARSVCESEYGLFTRINNKYLHPNPQILYQEAENSQKYYEFIGKMMAKSILIKELFDCNFSNIIYSSLVSKNPGPFTLKDLNDFDKELAQSLEWILDNDVTGIIMETFVTKSTAFGDLKTQELIPGGAQLEVTELNKHQYVELMVEHILYKNVEQQIQAICQGFWSVIPLSLVNILSAIELEDLLCGARTIDVDEWQANTVYQTYNSSSPTIKYFWQAVKSLSEFEQRQLLLFSTGSDRVSTLGFSNGGGTKFTVGKQYDGPKSTDVTMPTSSTCISLLNLPEYRSYDEAIKSIRKALEYGTLGFGFG